MVDSHVIAGNIIAKLGVKYLYIVSFAVMKPLLGGIYFLVWETTYPRPPPAIPNFNFQKNDSDEPASPSDSSSKDGSTGHTRPEDLKKGGIVETIEDTQDLPTPEEEPPTPYKPPTEGTALDPKNTLMQNLRIYRGRVSDRGLIK